MSAVRVGATGEWGCAHSGAAKNRTVGSISTAGRGRRTYRPNSVFPHLLSTVVTSIIPDWADILKPMAIPVHRGEIGPLCLLPLSQDITQPYLAALSSRTEGFRVDHLGVLLFYRFWSRGEGGLWPRPANRFFSASRA